jgi:hypothetical protein
VLTDADAAQADRILAEAAPGLTFGELRHAAHKLVLHLDPEAAKKRKEAARQEAHVRRFREDSGNAGMVARELPSDEVLASWQHVEQRALDLRAAGMPGTLQELRVRAYLDLLQERDSRDLPDSQAPASREGTGDQPGPGTSRRPARTRPLRPAPGLTELTGLTGTAAQATGQAARVAAARTARPVLVTVPRRVQAPGRAWPRWSPLPSHWPPSKDGPRRRERPTGSGRWTATTSATWPPPRRWTATTSATWPPPPHPLVPDRGQSRRHGRRPRLPPGPASPAGPGPPGGRPRSRPVARHRTPALAARPEHHDDPGRPRPLRPRPRRDRLPPQPHTHPSDPRP